jgi:hypothetical protein
VSKEWVQQVEISFEERKGGEGRDDSLDDGFENVLNPLHARLDPARVLIHVQDIRGIAAGKKRAG